MAFIGKVGNLLKQSVGKHINFELSASNPSIFQAIRCMSSSKLFVGGLSYGTDDTSLKEAFAAYGEVIEARVILDRETGRSRGFGFISFTSSEEASNAIQAMDGQDLHGRRVRVNYATDRAGGFRSGGGYGSGGYGGSGGGNSYGSGGNYGGGGGGYSSGYGGGGSYNSGYDGGSRAGGSYSSGGGGYGGGNGYDGGSSSGNSSVPSVGGSDINFSGGGDDSSYASGGYAASTGMPNVGSNQYTGDNGDITASEGYGQDDPLEGNFKDNDDEPGDYADKRV